jgi:hypothetical protein
VTERGGRIKPAEINARFTAYRDALGLPRPWSSSGPCWPAHSGRMRGDGEKEPPVAGKLAAAVAAWGS